MVSVQTLRDLSEKYRQEVIEPAEKAGVPWKHRRSEDVMRDIAAKTAINRIEREDVERFRETLENSCYIDINDYQRIATKSAIYPGKGTPFGLMYAALGLAEAGEVQNKVKKAFRERNGSDEPWCEVSYGVITPERRVQIVKELGGVLWYIAAVCDEIGATMSDVALQNLEELCSRGERGTLRGDGDDR